MKHKRQLEPEGTMSMRRERPRLSKARHRSLESESEALLRQEQNGRPVLIQSSQSDSLPVSSAVQSTKVL